jgi:hypothetical protein
MNAYKPADSPRPRARTGASGPLGHRALALLDVTATLALAAVREMLARSNHTPVASTRPREPRRQEIGQA